GFDGCTARAREFEMRLLRWRDEGADDEAAGYLSDDAAGEEVDGHGQPGPPDDDRGPLTDDDAASVLWYELTARGFRLSRTPLDVAGPLARHRARSQAAWVFTSATLAIGGRFEHYAIKLGLSEPT